MEIEADRLVSVAALPGAACNAIGDSCSFDRRRIHAEGRLFSLNGGDMFVIQASDD